MTNDKYSYQHSTSIGNNTTEYPHQTETTLIFKLNQIFFEKSVFFLENVDFPI